MDRLYLFCATHPSVFTASSSISPVQVQWFSRKKRRLGHESRVGSAIDLSGMDQERVAEIDRPRSAGSQDFIEASSSAVVQLSWAQPRLPGGRTQLGDLKM